jgi:hypothetical protein
MGISIEATAATSAVPHASRKAGPIRVHFVTNAGRARTYDKLLIVDLPLRCLTVHSFMASPAAVAADIVID